VLATVDFAWHRVDYDAGLEGECLPATSKNAVQSSLGRQPALLGSAPVAPKHPRKTVTMLLRVTDPLMPRPSASSGRSSVADHFAPTALASKPLGPYRTLETCRGLTRVAADRARAPIEVRGSRHS